MAVELRNNAEGGSDTTVETTGNSGGASGNAWDTVTGSPTFSATHAHGGTLCHSFPSAATTNVQWSATSIGSMTTIYCRLYIYPTANPAATSNLMMGKAGATQAFRISIGTTGKVFLTDSAGSANLQSTGSLSLNAWNRVEVAITPGVTTSSGVGELRTYTGAAVDSSSATEDLNISAQNYGAGPITILGFGLMTGTSSITWFLDDVGCSDTTWLGSSLATAVGGQSAVPGQTWRRHFQHRQRPLSAAPPTGPQSYTQAVSGGLSFAGATIKLDTDHLTGAVLSFAGVATLRTGKAVTAVLSFAGAQTRRVGKGLAAGLSFTGAQSHAVVHTLTAGLSFAGAVVRAVRTGLLGATLTFAGAVTKRTARAVTGVLSFTGNLASAAVHFYQQALTAVLSFTGAQSRRTSKTTTAALSFTGTQGRTTSHQNAATLSFTGGQTRRVGSGQSAGVSFTGATTKRTVRGLTAGLSFVGGISTAVVHVYQKALTGALSFTGVQTKRAGKALAGLLSFIGGVTGVKAAGAPFTVGRLTGTTTATSTVTGTTALAVIAVAIYPSATTYPAATLFPDSPAAGTLTGTTAATATLAGGDQATAGVLIYPGSDTYPGAALYPGIYWQAGTFSTTTQRTGGPN